MKVSYNDLEKFLNELWDLDDNRSIPEKHYSLNLQGRLRGTRSGRDLARQKLYDMFDESILNRPTYKLFVELLDNYNIKTGEAEVFTNEERRENESFMNELFKTRVMKKLLDFLMELGIFSDANSLKRELNRIWFHFYRRSDVRDSSGFEHVFVGEIRDGQIIGMHNWLQVYLQEKNGNIDYKGYFDRGTSNEGESPRIITMQFCWKDGTPKPIGSSFIGTSPEFEFAFFSALHFLDVDSNTEINLGGYRIKLMHHKLAGNRIGTSYIQGLE